jgi:hypothetical protein
MVLLKGLWFLLVESWANVPVFAVLGISLLVGFKTWDMADDKRAIAEHEAGKTEHVQKKVKKVRKARKRVRRSDDAVRRMLEKYPGRD